MTREEVLAALKEILVTDFRVDESKIVPEASFRGTLGLDSLDAVDLIYLLAKKYDLPSDLEFWRDLHTVDKVVSHVAAELAKRG